MRARTLALFLVFENAFFSNMSIKLKQHVFISFKTEDREYALTLKSSLEDSGFDVWWHEDLQCGQMWYAEIDKAIDSAGAVIVLWSALSLKSAWVRHEASQAIAKKIYTPVRIELIAIEPPFDPIQATDMIGWNGKGEHLGYQNLVDRLNLLIPRPIGIFVRFFRFVWFQRAAIGAMLVATLAIYFLILQRQAQELQLEQMRDVVEKADTQILVQNQMSKKLESQSKALDSQNKKLAGQGEILQSQISQQKYLINGVNTALTSLNSTIYPLDSIDLFWLTDIYFEPFINHNNCQFSVLFVDSNKYRKNITMFPRTGALSIFSLPESDVVDAWVSLGISKNRFLAYGSRSGSNTSDYVGYFERHFFEGLLKTNRRMQNALQLEGMTMILVIYFNQPVKVRSNHHFELSWDPERGLPRIPLKIEQDFFNDGIVIRTHFKKDDIGIFHK